MLTGCQPAGSADLGRVEAPLRDGVRSLTVGRSVEGRPLTCGIFGTGRRTTLLLAGIHGNEPAGRPLLKLLVDHLQEHDAAFYDQRVVLLPSANPDGLARRSRYNSRGVDLNRNFAASNWRKSRRHGPRPLSEPESRAIVALIDRYRPRAIISIHQPFNVIDYDGPGADLAGAMSAHSGMTVRKLGSRPGSLGSYAGTSLGIPVITLELPASASRLQPAALWSRYGEMLIAAIRFAGRES